jgi:hypothetical protein
MFCPLSIVPLQGAERTLRANLFSVSTSEVQQTLAYPDKLVEFTRINRYSGLMKQKIALKDKN